MQNVFDQEGVVGASFLLLHSRIKGEFLFSLVPCLLENLAAFLHLCWILCVLVALILA